MCGGPGHSDAPKSDAPGALIPGFPVWLGGGLLQQQFEAQFFVTLAEDAIDRPLGGVLDGMPERGTEDRAEQDANQTPDRRADEEGEEGNPTTRAVHTPPRRRPQRTFPSGAYVRCAAI